jgi:antitoxin HicB
VELYRAVRAQGVAKAELARRLGWHGPEVDRLFNLNLRSTIEQIDQALRAIGERLEVSVQDGVSVRAAVSRRVGRRGAGAMR